MVSSSVTDSSLFSGSPNSGDVAKNKTANLSSKLKEWKLDAGLRQWGFHSKRGHVAGEGNGSRTKVLPENQTERKRDSPIGYLQLGWNDGDIDDAVTGWNFESDAESSAANSPTSVLTSKDSGSKSSDCFCCSGKMGEEEEEVYGDAFDNFEGFTDALNYFDNENKSPSPEAMNEEEESPRMSHRISVPNQALHRERSATRESVNLERESPRMSPRNSSPDKAIHGEKSHLLEMKNAEQGSTKMSRRDSSANSALHGKKSPLRETKKSEQEASSTQRIFSTVPSPCPICCEEMDATDLCFLPCPCGFKLCLFCHKKIIDDDGRCPNCRKEYKKNNVTGEVSFQQRGRGILRLSPSFRGLDRA